jgi:DNA (cytosine-5)-methyltransferase 1
VFVVGCLGDQRSAAAVLFERESVRRNTPPRRETREGIAGTAGDGTTAGSRRQWPAKIASTLYAKFGDKLGLENQHIDEGAPLFVPAAKQPIVLMDQGGSVMNTLTDGTVGTLRREMHGHEPVVAFSSNMSKPDCQADGISPTLKLGGHGGNPPAVAVRTANTSANGHGVSFELSHTLDGAQGQAVAIGNDCYNGAITGEIAATMGTHGSSSNSSGPTVMQAMVSPTITATNDPSRSPQSSEITRQVAAVHQATMQVRRLAPIECERLQGFPDGYTQVPHRGKPAADGPRYKALGNFMAVPVVRWIGERINMILNRED